MGPISDGTWARLSAIGLVVVVTLIAVVALFGRPPPPPPKPSFAVAVRAVETDATTPTALPTPSATTLRPPPTPAPSYGHYVFGDDGIFGLPGYPWRGSKATPPPPLHVFNYRSHAPAGSTRR